VGFLFIIISSAATGTTTTTVVFGHIGGADSLDLLVLLLRCWRSIGPNSTGGENISSTIF
jgi:hypothetical protein